MLLSGHRVLVVEDEAVIALDLALAIEEANSCGLGPVESVRQTLALVEDAQVTGAVLDITVRDGEVAAWLRERSIPFVMHTGGGLPPRLEPRFPASRFSPRQRPRRAWWWAWWPRSKLPGQQS